MEDKNKKGRRDVLKSLATVPVVGALAYGWYRKKQHDLLLKKSIHEEVNIDAVNPVAIREVPKDKQIRLGIIGTGGRGRSLLKAVGFLNPEMIDDWIASAKENSNDNRYEEYLEQEDLNVVVNGVCDIYDINAEKGLKACANTERQSSSGKMGNAPKRYTTYKDAYPCR